MADAAALQTEIDRLNGILNGKKRSNFKLWRRIHAVMYAVLCGGFIVLAIGQYTRRADKQGVLNGTDKMSEPNRLYDAAGDFGNFSNFMAFFGNCISALGVLFWILTLVVRRFRNYIFKEDKELTTVYHFYEFLFATTNITFLVSDPLFISYMPTVSLSNIYEFAFPFICAMLGILGIIAIIQMVSGLARFNNNTN
ncbi:hypothetical protein BX667DRAFT_224827 [Coemansia mojavensis]|nr:hypothetical protein BX667DRAFT_224827 [Coemansia mojavensis]